MKLVEPGIEVPVQAEQVLPRWGIWYGQEAVHETLSNAYPAVVIASLFSFFNGSRRRAFRIFWSTQMDPSDLGGGNPVGWFTAGGIGLAWGLTWLRKFFSSTNAAVANDRAEKDMLERLTDENKTLRTDLETVTKERNEMYRTVGELTGTMKAMKSQLDLQEAQISQLTSEVSQLRQALQRTGYERRNPEAS
ncbi:hypothetical protein V6W80_11695 [Pseudomonas benzopyrenica]|uniref:Uncharacterized protein n=2 Tax=Pseudomonas benzopyrenica TaxID=2993566 RepID=A0ABZ2FXQ9_9PSED